MSQIEPPPPEVRARLARLARKRLRAQGIQVTGLGSYDLQDIICREYDESDDDETTLSWIMKAVQADLPESGNLYFSKIKPNIALLEPRHGVAYVTLEREVNPRLVEAVESTRFAIWNTISPPFPASDLGLDKSEAQALAWLNGQHQAGRRKGRLQIRLECEVDDLDSASLALNDLLNAWADDEAWLASGRPAEPVLRALASSLQGVQARVAFGRERATADLPELTWTGSDESLSLSETGEAVRVPPTGLLRTLYEGVQTIVRASGWWEPWQALHHVMTGYPPTPLTGRTVHKTSKKYWLWTKRSPDVTGLQGLRALPWPASTTRIEGPVSTAEWLALAPRVVTPGGRGPKRLSRTHVALLQLKVQTPDYSWGERLAVWDKWRKTYKELELTEFKGIPVERMLRKEWERAVERVSKWVVAMDMNS